MEACSELSGCYHNEKVYATIFNYDSQDLCSGQSSTGYENISQTEGHRSSLVINSSSNVFCLQ